MLQGRFQKRGNFSDQKYLSLSSLQTDYLTLDSISDRNNERENLVKVKCTFCGGSHPTERKNSRQGESSRGW